LVNLFYYQRGIIYESNNNYGGRIMQQSKMLKNFSGLLLVLLTSLIMVNRASAKAEFLGPAAAAGININAGCATCHTAAVGDKNNVKPNYAAAYKLDKTGFSKLANLIKGCPSGQTLNTSTFVCTASAPTPVPCVAPKKLVNGVCTLPAPTPVPCVVPKKLVNGVCTLPAPTPVPCVAPKKLVNGVCTLPAPTPVPCVAPKKLVNGVCTLPAPTPVPCVAPKKLVNGVCTLPAPTPVPCVAPKKLVNGVCILPTPVSCDEKDDDGDDDKSSLKISDPGKVFVHAGKILRVGITVFGDDRKTIMGVSDLPNGARFYDAYNPSLRSQEGVLLWRVPLELAGKKMKFKLCGKTSGGGKGNSHATRDVKVEVLSPTSNTVKADPVVSANYVTSSVYNPVTGKLETSGQITWYWKSTLAERQAALAQPVEMFEAESNTPLGSTKVGLDGRWFISVAVASNNLPRVVDASFLGRLGTEPVQQSGISDSDDQDDDGDDDLEDDKEAKKDKDD
jgi:hypothetical protein